MVLQDVPRGAVEAEGQGGIRVMIVDDSRVVRSLLARWLRDADGIDLVAQHRDGRSAADDVVRAQPDIVILDIEMPQMDGLTALPLILSRKPGTRVLVVSTLTRRGAAVSIEALTLGAADYIAKPDPSALGSNEAFREELLGKIRMLGKRALAARVRRAKAVAAPASARAPFGEAVSVASETFELRQPSEAPVPAIVIASSTGGPQALQRVFEILGPVMDRVPILVTQHMPATFTSLLADHLGRIAGRPAAEGQEGELIMPGTIRVAPGDRHMIVAAKAGRPVLRLTDDPPVHFCRPAADKLFVSAARIFGRGMLGLVLTGMGSDGAEGATAIADSGGSVLAQDEVSSVVWGMPRATVEAGAACAVLSIEALAARAAAMIRGPRP